MENLQAFMFTLCVFLVTQSYYVLLCPGVIFSPLRLLDSYALGAIAWFVQIEPECECGTVRKQLKRMFIRMGSSSGSDRGISILVRGMSPMSIPHA
jgi:hypothetical protein